MGKLRHLTTVASHLGVTAADLDSAGALNATLDCDVQLFIDPVLLPLSQHAEMKVEANGLFQKHFQDLILLLKSSRSPGDRPWKEALRRMRYREIPGTGLGYGSATVRGSGLGSDLTQELIAEAKEIIDLGVSTPELFALLGLFTEGIGPDRISDITTNIIKPALLRFTERVIRELPIQKGLVTRSQQEGEELFRVPDNPHHSVPLILVPSDVLRKLPTVSDWDDICTAAAQNDELREKVNRHVGEIWHAADRDEKKAVLKRLAETQGEVFTAVRDTVYSDDITRRRRYDPSRDSALSGAPALEAGQAAALSEPLSLVAPSKRTVNALLDVVAAIVGQFQHLVENRDLWKEMWDGNRHRKEKTAQHLFFAVAHSYCTANDIDVSPEADTGRGPVDFKFSSGSDAKVLVELKLSDNSKLVHGYETQLPLYQKGEETTKAVYVVMEVSEEDAKYERLMKIKNDRVAKNQPSPEIVYIDATPKRSASKA